MRGVSLIPRSDNFQPRPHSSIQSLVNRLESAKFSEISKKFSRKNFRVKTEFYKIFIFEFYSQANFKKKKFRKK